MTEEIMRTIDAREVETWFFHLLDDVAAGKEIAITWNGESVAILIPAKLGLQKGDQPFKGGQMAARRNYLILRD